MARPRNIFYYYIHIGRDRDRQLKHLFWDCQSNHPKYQVPRSLTVQSSYFGLVHLNTARVGIKTRDLQSDYRRTMIQHQISVLVFHSMYNPILITTGQTCYTTHHPGGLGTE